ncbi:MAG TPA: hypothetical protein VLM38_17285 [Blastocatellia bacterium]|nr:hypothetical protein [Blastocatellia bacterium]
MQIERSTKMPSQVRGRRNQRRREALDPANVEPNALRDAVYTALSLLPEDERARVYDRIVADLEKSGVNLRQHIVVLGIPARTIDELTASDIAKLVRYVRMNEPRALKALVPILDELLNQPVELARSA